MKSGADAVSEPSGAGRGDGKRALRRAWMFPFAAAGIVFMFLWFRPEFPRSLNGINDFLGIYAGARLAGTPEQFDAGAYVREQVRATGWVAPAILYTRLPAFAAVLRPLGKLEYRRAYLVWEALLLASLGAFLAVWPAPDRGLLWCAVCWSFPLAASLAAGQDAAFLLLMLAIVWRLGPSRPFLAGAVLGLCTLKFHLFLLVPVFLMAQRRWRIMAGASVTTGAILAGCFAVAGGNWLPAYARFVMQGRTNPDVRAMASLYGLLDGLPHGLAWEAAGAVLAAGAVWWVAARTSFSLGLSAALVGSLLTSHHAYHGDTLILLPCLLTLAAELPRLSVRLPCVLLLSPLPFLVTPVVPLAGPLPLLLAALLVALTAAAGASPARGRETASL